MTSPGPTTSPQTSRNPGKKTFTNRKGHGEIKYFLDENHAIDLPRIGRFPQPDSKENVLRSYGYVFAQIIQNNFQSLAADSFRKSRIRGFTNPKAPNRSMKKTPFPERQKASGVLVKNQNIFKLPMKPDQFSIPKKRGE